MWPKSRKRVKTMGKATAKLGQQPNSPPTRVRAKRLWNRAFWALLAVAILVVIGAVVLSRVRQPQLELSAEPPGPKIAPDFQIVAYQGEDLLGGKEVKFSQLFRHRQPVVLNFWAGLCPPCRAEMPDLQQASQEYKDRVLLFGLDVGPFVALGSREDGKALLKELQVTYPVGTTFDAEVVRKYQILGRPTTVFTKPDRKIVRTWTGVLTKKKLAELVEELLAASDKR